MKLLLSLVTIFKFLICSVISLEPYTSLYSFNVDGKGPYYYRQENGKRIDGFTRYKLLRTPSLSFAKCMYQCSSTTTCYMGVFNRLKSECQLYNFVATDSYLVDDTDSYTFFKGSNNIFISTFYKKKKCKILFFIKAPDLSPPPGIILFYLLSFPF
jgi:hypothetical protein